MFTYKTLHEKGQFFHKQILYKRKGITMINFGWTNDIDNLVRNGIIDYDAAADITGSAPRYAGAYAQNIPQFNQALVPKNDQFVSENENKPLSKNPAWKKALAGMLVAGLALLGGFAIFKGKGSGLFKKTT